VVFSTSLIVGFRIDLVQSTGDLCGTPTLGNTKCGHKIWRSGAAIVTDFATSPIFKRNRCGETLAKGGSVCDLVHRSVRPVARDNADSHLTCVDIEIRRQVTGGQTTPLNVTGIKRVTAGAILDLHAQSDIGAQCTELGRRPGVKIGVTTRQPGVSVRSPVLPTWIGHDIAVIKHIVHDKLRAQTTTDAQAGLGARDVVEAGAVGITDTNVVNRLRSDREVGCLCGGGSGCCCRTKQDCFEFHSRHLKILLKGVSCPLLGTDEMLVLPGFPNSGMQQNYSFCTNTGNSKDAAVVKPGKIE